MSAKNGTERTANQAAPADAEERSGYLGFVAHEVRNPLSTALWSAELLARMSAAERGGARGEKLTAMCLRSLGRVRQLVEDHFLCERLEVGGLPVRPEPISLRDALEHAAGHRPGDVGEVSLDGVEAALAVSADRALLERVLDALVAAAGREGEPVRVSARLDGGRAVLRVSGAEAGPGALDDPRKGAAGDPKGRALALPAARRAAAALGGGLSVEGGAFVLTLPGAGAYTARPASPPLP
ncbi:sensor histidine kinase KdpD [Anaeromyxobacter sp. PSR-1]|uniref:sensor histidine kinase n=1 Tax=unclassified Anaeromyxobacter TaxID=2620896 RepID=UPI0005E7DC46|nr:histidine kinase dimerization/phospho-acceptor domain-containing protein [Anaeromyxobacter sp. PSR-1]GAO03731.1 sensor protein RstB [Anaeromyxobacter sp. PSR-1]